MARWSSGTRSLHISSVVSAQVARESRSGYACPFATLGTGVLSADISVAATVLLSRTPCKLGKSPFLKISVYLVLVNAAAYSGSHIGKICVPSINLCYIFS